jgi:hypothetical protein
MGEETVAKEAQVQESLEDYKMTWKEFKELCEQHGISDNDIVDDIDISWGNRKYFKCEKDDVYGWKISLISI